MAPTEECPIEFKSLIDYTKDGELDYSIYQEYYKGDCKFFESPNVERNECLGCYIDNYCRYKTKMFEPQPKAPWWL